MADEEDLVSKVVVTGIDSVNQKFTTLGDTGEKAFDKIDKAAADAAKGVKKSSRDIEQATGQVSASFADLARQRIAGAATADLGQIERSTRQLVAVTRSAIPAISSFVARLTAAGAGAVAAGVGILKLAQNVAKASTTQVDATDKMVAAQVEANNTQLAGRIAAINLDSAQRQLFASLGRGEISYADYSKQLKELNRNYAEQQRVARATAAAQESVRIENERLQKQAADTKAYQGQIDIFGGPLLSALITLGGQAKALFGEFQQAFGPAIAQGIGVISKALATNGQSISAFFSDASAKITNFISNNGPAIEKAFNSIGNAIKIVFDGVLNALPGLLEFFNNTLVPAVTAFGALLTKIADGINAVFGTNLTGGALVFIVILGQMTGSFIALIQVLRIAAAAIGIIMGLPFGTVFVLVAAAIGVLLYLFPQLRQTALNALNSIIATWNGVAAGAAAAGARVTATWNAVVAFFSSIFAGIAAIFTAGWQLVVDGVNGTVAIVQAAWGAVVEFFRGIVNAISQFFIDLWNGVVAAFNTAVATIKGLFDQLWAAAKAKLQPIIGLLEAIADLAKSALPSGGGGTPGVTAASGGHIRGPGTGTSDSIPAWLSNNEFVVKSRMVGKYGLGLLHAINNGTFKMPKFNMGGLVNAMALSPGPRLAYADGGEVSSPATLRPINLSMFGEEFKMMAPEEVGTRLTKFAVARQTRSAGRKPAWLGKGRN